MSEEITNEKLDLVKAEKLLGTGEEYDLKHVLTCFQIMVGVKEDNEEFDDIPEIIKAKNEIVQSFISAEIRLNKKFNIKDGIPFENVCRRCSGTGELYEFIKDTKMIKCRVCRGEHEGKVYKECPDCKNADSELECLKCKDSGKKGHILVKCDRCKGTTKEMIHPITDKIKSTTPCKRCKGLGWKTPKEQPPPSNPVISETIGEAIKKGKADEEEVAEE